jgi:nitroreductase
VLQNLRRGQIIIFKKKLVKMDSLRRVLEAARWAPSGDNSQPWRFRVVDAETFYLLLPPPDTTNVFQTKGAMHLVHAGLVTEALSLAAGAEGLVLDTEASVRDGERAGAFLYRLRPGATRADPLLAQLRRRATDRRGYSTKALTSGQKFVLEDCFRETPFEIRWHESLRQRLRLARLSAEAFKVRMEHEDSFYVNQSVVDFERPADSPTGLGSRTLGLSAASHFLASWALGAGWARQKFLNAWTPTLAVVSTEFEILPAVQAGSLFTVVGRDGARRGVQLPDRSEAELVALGRALLRTWLAATEMGLVLHPSLVLAAVSWDANSAALQRELSTSTARDRLRRVREGLAAHHEGAAPLFQARIGYPPPEPLPARSTRRALEELLVDENA